MVVWIWIVPREVKKAHSQAAKKPPTTLFLQAHSEFDEVVHSYSKEEKHKRRLWNSLQVSYSDGSLDFLQGVS